MCGADVSVSYRRRYRRAGDGISDLVKSVLEKTPWGRSTHFIGNLPLSHNGEGSLTFWQAWQQNWSLPINFAEMDQSLILSLILRKKPHFSHAISVLCLVNNVTSFLLQQSNAFSMSTGQSVFVLIYTLLKEYKENYLSLF